MDKKKLERANQLDGLITLAEKIKDTNVLSTTNLGDYIDRLKREDDTFRKEFDNLMWATLKRFREEFDNM